MDLIVNNLNSFIWASIVAAVLFGIWLISDVLKRPAGDEKMQEIAKAIQQGAAAYLKRQYLVVGVVAIVLAAIIYQLLGQNSALGFLVGAILSALAMFVIVVSNLGSLDVVFRDIAILFMAIALAILSYKRR